MSAIAASPLPSWDLTAAFPSLDSPEFKRNFEELVADIRQFESLVAAAESLGLGSRDGSATPILSDGAIKAFEEVVSFYNDLQSRIRTTDAFIGGYTSTDSRNELALAKDSEMEAALVPMAKLNTRFTAWLGTLDIDALIQKSSIAKEHEYAIRKAVVSAKHLMSPAEEALAADLAPTGASAWAKLHNNVTSQIEVALNVRGKEESMPMSMVRNLAFDPDRDVRRAAYEAELTTWKAWEVPLAAAMNSIKGQVEKLAERRGWETPLDEALFAANIDRETLDAMMASAREAFPDFRRYLQAKAKALGLQKLAFYDIFAPVGRSSRSWDYSEATRFVVEQFGSYSQKLADYAARAFEGDWIDVAPKPGKSDGAFCMWFIRDESRILMNYKQAFGSVKTLAHELGHGYHNLCLSNRTMLQRRTPMTLAETASIFCETIVKNAVLKNADREERISILEGSLQGACQTSVDITSRFLFEQRVFDGGEKRELSASEFCEIMLQAQRETYGEGLDSEFLHPYMWAVKPHYYSSRSFYNFPYMFGMLFGLGLYAQYEQEPESFKSKYDDLLSSTGLADAATLANRFGINIRTQDFWRSGFDVLRGEINEFEKAVS